MLIERLLRSNRSRLLMAGRGVLADALSEVEESADPGDEELRRYSEAGASNVVRYRFPARARDPDAFFCSDFITDYSEGVLIEGDSPLGFVPELTVFVAPAVPEGTSLLRRGPVDEAGAYEQWVERLGVLRGEAGGRTDFVQRLAEMSSTRSPRVPGGGHDGALELLAGALARSEVRAAPSAAQRWCLAEGYAGLKRAQVVVINVRSPAERERGEAMLPELKRLRKDRKVFDDVIGWSGKRLPITAGVVDLADPKDKGLKRILARIKRAFV